MGNLLNKALLFKEWKTARVMLIIFTLYIFIAKTVFILNNIPLKDNEFNIGMPGEKSITMEDRVIHNSDRFIGYLVSEERFPFNVIMIGLILIFAFAQMFPEKWGKNDSIAYSLPIERGTIMSNKLFMGFIMILSAVVLNVIPILSVYFSNIQLLGDYISAGDILKWAVRSVFAYWAIYSLFMFVFAVCGNIFAGAIISPCVLVFPMAFMGCVAIYMRSASVWINGQERANIVFNSIQNSLLARKIQYFIETISLFAYSGFYGFNRVFANGYEAINRVAVIEPFWIYNILFLTPIIILFASLAIYSFQKSRLERKNWIIQFKPLMLLFSICFVLGFTAFGSSILMEMFFSAHAYKSPKPEIAVIVTLLTFVVGVLISIKLATIGRRVRLIDFILRKGVTRDEKI